MVNLYHEPNIQKLQFGTAGGRVWLGPSARWEEAISLTHRRPVSRRRDMTPDKLVRTLAGGMARTQSPSLARGARRLRAV